MLNSNAPIDHMPSEVVELNGEVFRPGPCFVVGCYLNATSVIFECPAFHFWSWEADFEALGLEFLDEVHDGDHFPERGRQGDIFGFRGG